MSWVRLRYLDLIMVVFFGIIEMIMFLEFRKNFRNLVIWFGVVIYFDLWIVNFSDLSRVIVLVIIWVNLWGVFVNKRILLMYFTIRYFFDFKVVYIGFMSFVNILGVDESLLGK